ncbi:hypothetical protein AV540_01825 [Brevibacillus parabrevis]|uniref:leucine-rich repeat domain-containing protein n=1 Tax=Brevibacillus parabrevis TaxID=54914 RepID=UPI0007AB4126|nr:leucine-rich repeat domain-containing protein [Brevibacillus parabrevis]KZE46371.1 hypothetical protein AV540_01825 [Brevibacillus parabrevis]
MEKVFRDTLHKPHGTLTKADLDKITSIAIYGPRYGLESLAGIEVLPNLTEIDLQGFQALDLKSLAKLPKLKKASFSVVEIADVSPLQRIEDLSMHYAEVKNIDSLKQLKQLQKLFIYRYSGSTDVSPLLERLQNSTRMKEIHVIDNEVTNLQPLGQMKNLEVLQLVIDNPIYDQTVKPLAGLRNMKALMLSPREKSLTSLEFLRQQKKLEYLIVRQQNISDLQPLKELTQLRYLDVGENDISETAPLQSMTKLIWLNLKQNQVKNLDGLLLNVQKGGFAPKGYICLSMNPLLERASAKTKQELATLAKKGIQVEIDESDSPKNDGVLPEELYFW